MALTQNTAIKLGAAKIDITPTLPIYLAGFAHRTLPADRIDEPLHLRINCFADDLGTMLVLIQADLIWWGQAYVDRIRETLAEHYDLPADAIILHASHTHSAPQASEDFVPMLGELDTAYMDYVVQQTLQGVALAIDDLEFVTIQRAHSSFNFAVYRRLTIDGVMTMAPNPEVPIDNELTIIRFTRTSNQEEKAICFHLACHPTTTADNAVSSEFLGVAAERLAAHFPANDVLVTPLQGTAGDVRPNLSRDGAFYRGTQADVLRQAKELESSILQALSEPMETLPSGPLLKRSTSVDLPFMSIPTEQELDLANSADQPQQVQEWAALLQSNPHRLRTYANLELTAWSLGPDLELIAFNGEIVGAYGLYTKTLSEGRALPLAYSNGMIGYVPTAKQIDEGGYESLTSFHYFGLPSPYTQAIERNIHDGITRTLISLDKKKESRS